MSRRVVAVLAMIRASRSRAEFFRIMRGLDGKRGLEIGGPSAVFRRFHQWPVYPMRVELENLDFAARTLWSELAPKSRYTMTLIGEAATLSGIPDGRYDFMVASHVLEHIANPIGALASWRRVVVPGGLLIVVVPHCEGTFDHRRPVTTIEHMWCDFLAGVGEGDTTHLKEVADLHDLDRDPDAGGRERFVARAYDNLRVRAVHHHVFTTESLLSLLDRVGLHILYAEAARPHHICAVVEVPDTGGAPKTALGDTHPASNWRYLDAEAEWRTRSPFRIDRVSRHGSPLA